MAAAFGQATPVRVAQLQQEPPAEMNRSISVGPKSSDDVLHLTISLPYGDPEGIQNFVDAVSDPHSPMYRHFLTPEQVGARFGLPAYRVANVRQYFELQGMTVRLEAKNRLALLVDTNVGQAEAAFGTTIQNFIAPSEFGLPYVTRFSYATPLRVPAEIAGDILDVCGMDSFTRPISHTAITATQMRTLYSVASLYGANGKEGAGRTIAISNYDGFRVSNVALECTLQGLPTPSGGAGSNVTIEEIDGGTGGSGTAAGEGDLDIQAILRMAPLSNVIVYDNYQSSTTTGNNPLAVLTQEEDDNTADILTESYGWSMSTSTNLSCHDEHLSMSAQGQTYCVASGDHGTTWTVSGVDFDYPAIEPEVLLCGGTSVTVSSTGARSTEVGWDDTYGEGGGGWNVTSDTFNTRPTYQLTTTFEANAGVPSASSVPYRLVPDVAFDADPVTGYLVYVSGTEEQMGGTSASSPTCAGMLAELEEQLINDGALKANSSGKYRMGRVQDLLYSYNGLSSVFYGITSGTNGTLPNGSTSEAVKGWNTDAGWGPIIFSGLVAEIEQGVASVSLSPTTVAGGATSTGTVTLGVAAPTGGAVVTLTSSNTADATVPASVTVAAGATTATFTVSTVSVTAATSATITATYNGISRTASLTVNPNTVKSVSLSPTSVAGGASSTGTVTISSAAPAAGQVVLLSSSSSSATVPATVTVASGATTATFTVSTTAVTASTTATITSAIGSSSATASLTITAPVALKSVAVSPTTVVGGASSTGTVTLSSAAPTGGTVVSLSSSTTSATVPTSVTVAAGATTATFSVTTKAVSANTSATITAKSGSSSTTAVLTIDTATLSQVSLSSTSVVGGCNVTITGRVTLTGAAATAETITLASSSTTAATVPASVSIVAGATSATFTVSHKVVTASTLTTIKATLGSTSASTTLTVSPFQISTFTVSPTSLVGGASSTGTVTLNATPGSTSGAIKVTLTSSSTSATAAASISVAVGSASGTFTVTTKAVTKSTSATITGTVGSASKTATLTIES